MKVAVLGSGNGAHAAAFEWARAGHDVYMFDFPQFDKSIGAIAEAGGITSHGEMEGFEKIAYAGTDIEKVIRGAAVVIAVGPAYSTEPFGKACAPYIEDGQIYVVMPTSCMGAVTFKHALGLAIDDGRITMAETSTLPYAVRITGPAKIEVYNRLPAGNLLSALPKERIDEVYEILHTAHPGLEKAKSVFQTTLQNANPVIHPAITTVNAALIERTHGDFFFYTEGVTQAGGNLMEALDKERMTLGRALGLTIEADPEISIRQGYLSKPDYVSGYTDAPGFEGIKAQHSLDYRYYNEDIGYSMVFWVSLAERLGVEVPLMRSMICVVSAIMKRDYLAEAPRTLDKIGLAGYTAEDLKKL